MTLTQVSQEALIREMDAIEIENRWRYLSGQLNNPEISRAQIYSEYFMLNEQYLQITGKQLSI